jgi:toxin ParE1/3/4
VNRVRFTCRAREDLLDIWLYVARRSSGAIADQICDRIEERCRRLREHPQIGRPRPEIAEGARAPVIERWLALYRLRDNGAQVVRIVDGSRDLTRIDWPPE